MSPVCYVHQFCGPLHPDGEALMAIKFRGVDFIGFDSLLSEDEILVRNTARQFVEDNLIPIIELCNREGRFPMELVKPMAELGFFGANLKGYGCAEMSNVEYGLVMQEMERGDSGVRSFASVQSALVMYPIHTFGSDEQKDKWLPALQKGEKIGCFALTEPDAGSNPGSRTADVHGKWSLRASVTSSLSLQDVRIPACNLLPKTDGLKSALMCLNQARYGIAWGAIGAAMACYDCALQYAQFRKQFRDQPIASHQLVQEKLVWMINEITKAQFMTLQVGRLKDQGKVGHQHISMAKRNNVWMALECARMARDILGANGIADDYPIMRHMMNLESVKTYEGTHDVHALIIGNSITGIDAF